MPDRRQKIIAIIGPTSTGKSDFAVELARRIDGEIISADSRQVYAGMNIGSGKITRREMRGVPHYALDIASPRQGSFNAAKFKRLADKLIAQISNRGRVPMLVGGTGFWIDAVASDMQLPEVPPDPDLRAKLKAMSNEKLLARLKKIDPKRAATIDAHNTHRLIRAVEIAEHSARAAKRKSVAGNYALHATPRPYPALFIGLDVPTEKLHRRIFIRGEKRFKKGMIAEVRRLHDQGVSWRKLESFGLEYRFIAQYLQGKLELQHMKDLLFTAQKQYAKRQRTWFKRNKQIVWFDPDKKSSLAKALGLARTFIR